VKLVVDANIVFSCLLTPSGVVGQVVLDPFSTLHLFAPEMLLSEITLHRPKLMRIVRRTEAEVAELETHVLSLFTVVPNGAIMETMWEKAADLVSGIDERDDHYIALALQLGCPLWTGDLKLHRGLKARRTGLTVTTSEVIGMLRG